MKGPRLIKTRRASDVEPCGSGDCDSIFFEESSSTFNLVGGCYTKSDPYWFHSSRCQTLKGLTQMVHHLSGKKWVTPLQIRNLISLAIMHTGVKVYGQ